MQQQQPIWADDDRIIHRSDPRTPRIEYRAAHCNRLAGNGAVVLDYDCLNITEAHRLAEHVQQPAIEQVEVFGCGNQATCIMP